MSRLEGAERLALALAGAWLVGGAPPRPPVVVGDAGEYALMTASLARHLSPDARPADDGPSRPRPRPTEYPSTSSTSCRATSRGRGADSTATTSGATR